MCRYLRLRDVHIWTGSMEETKQEKKEGTAERTYEFKISL